MSQPPKNEEVDEAIVEEKGRLTPPSPPSLFTDVSLHSSVYIRTLLARVHSEAPGSGEAEGRVPSSRARKRGSCSNVLWKRTIIGR